VDALLHGGIAPALAIVERASGRLLWSASATPPASRQFAAMHAAFSGSLTVLDLDGDGLHDRIYAGDLGGRLWRFDLHHGADAASWATGGVFADFSNPSGRGFVAAPDVSLAGPEAGGEPYFNIALGTAAPGNVATSNRYYVLRDHAPFDSWTMQDYDDWQPLREADLLRLAGPAGADARIDEGYYIELARGEVLSPVITVAGRAVLAIADSAATPATQCRVAVSIATLQVDTARVPAGATDEPAPWREPLPGSIVAGTAFTLAAADGPIAPCTLDGTHVAACDVDTKPLRTWWRREDAE
jgi:hypothetical protein